VALGISGVVRNQAHGGSSVEVALGSSNVGRHTTRTCGGTMVGSDLGLAGLDLGSDFLIVEN
jgi:hypothetical protein